MCSNYDRFIKDREIQKEMEDIDFYISYDEKFTKENYESLTQQDLKITDSILIVKNENSKSLFSIMQWGITWNSKIPIFNSRIETIREAGRWKDIFKQSRCLIPATAFYEFRPFENDTPESKLYKKEHKIKRKTKFGIGLPMHKFFFIGGIFIWDKNMFCCSMITTNNHPDLAKIPHHRSPYLIEPDKGREFLEADPEFLLDNINIYDKNKHLDIKQITKY